MKAKLGLEIAKIVGTVVVAGLVGYQATGTIEGTVTAIGTALGGLFVPAPRKEK